MQTMRDERSLHESTLQNDQILVFFFGTAKSQYSRKIFILVCFG